MKKIFYAFVVICFLSSCSGTEKGKLVSISASFSLSDAQSGNLTNNINYGNTLTVELENGKKVQALYDKDMISELKGGVSLELEFVDSLDMYNVVRIIE